MQLAPHPPTPPPAPGQEGTHLLVIRLHGDPHLLQVSGLHISLQFAKNPSSELTWQCQHSRAEQEEACFPEQGEGWALEENRAGKRSLSRPSAGRGLAQGRGENSHTYRALPRWTCPFPG